MSPSRRFEFIGRTANRKSTTILLSRWISSVIVFRLSPISSGSVSPPPSARWMSCRWMLIEVSGLRIS